MVYGVYSGGRKRTFCECDCDCGNHKLILYDSLEHGSVISCGCDLYARRSEKNRKDLTGMRFGRLVVKEMLWDSHPTRARCICDCGRETIVIGTGLTSHKTTSCGCIQKERASQSNTKDWSGVVSDYGVEFICRQSKNSHGQWLWRCRCGLCGKVFVALPAKIMNGHISSCGCRRKSSKEELIEYILKSHSIEYESQYSFSDCKYKDCLLFDFAVFKNGELSLLIEYDGKQHFEPVEFFGGVQSYEEAKKRDAIKNEYCEANNIFLLRLPYTLTDKEIKEKIISAVYP